ncbi:MAG: sugar ABC transporter substrate-binding protein [Firmicutes bacterium]|nr:sugar ABC transporter substrate-binding protein [Bacillota bacterium]
MKRLSYIIVMLTLVCLMAISVNAGASGKVLHILTLNWPQATIEQKLADQYFTPKTGIKVVVEALPYAFCEQKAKQELAGKSPYYDIINYDSQWLGGYVAAQGLERLDTKEYLQAPGCPVSVDTFIPEVCLRLMTYPNNEEQLFVKKDYEAAKKAPVYGLPWSLNAQILFYRKDLIPTPPKTWYEYKELAKKFNDPPRMYGTTFSASRTADFISMDYFPMMWSWGGSLWDEDEWKAEGVVNSKQNIESLEFFASFYKEGLAAPDTPNYQMDEKLNALTQGKVALCEEWNLVGGLMDNPAISKVVGKIGFAPLPAGPKGRVAMYGCQGMGINRYSKNKKEAWQYMLWFVSKETQQRLLSIPEASFFSSRKDMMEANRASNPWNRAFADSIPYVRDFWNIPPYAELLDTIQKELNLVYSGRASAKEALDHAAKILDSIYDSNRQYKPKND